MNECLRALPGDTARQNSNGARGSSRLEGKFILQEENQMIYNF
jgi:hypothetical protein